MLLQRREDRLAGKLGIFKDGRKPSRKSHSRVSERKRKERKGAIRAFLFVEEGHGWDIAHQSPGSSRHTQEKTGSRPARKK